MRPFGKWLALCLVLASPGAWAELNASLDRDRVALGDSLRLTITATGEDSLDGLELSPLLADFELLGRSTSSSTNIINGRTTRTNQQFLDLLPRREGNLRIPPLRTSSGQTGPISVTVGPAPQGPDGQQVVLFEAELDRDSVYVQGQLILTLRVQQAVNLESRSITELQLDNAFVKPLEQRSFQRQINDRPWLVHEIRYAIFPEQSGELVIPAQTFSARESLPRRSLFDMDNTGRQLRRRSDELRVEVLPRPDNFPGSTWLPARDLRIVETWSTPPEQLRAGESATRSLQITGEGLQGAQLPPILFPSTPGLKYYPDQPVISDTEVSSGLVGSRLDSAALVPTREGPLELPEIRIPWWDTQSDSLRYAVVPARQLQVKPALNPLPATSAQADTSIVSPPATLSGSPEPDYWRWLALASAGGWCLTLLYLLRRRLPRGEREPSSAGENPDEVRLYKQLLAACLSDQPQAVRNLILQWCQSLPGGQRITSITQAAGLLESQEFATLVTELDRTLYSGASTSWRGEPLAQLLKRLRGAYLKRHNRRPEPTLQLYPQRG